MSRILFLALLVTCLVSNGVLADDSTTGPKFKRGFHTDAIKFASNESDDAQAFTMIFDNFELATDTGRAGFPDVKTKSFTFARKIESTEDAHVELHIRGFVSYDGNASVSMIVHSGGQSTLVDLKKAIADADKNTADAENPTYKKAKEIAADQGFEDSDSNGESDDFFVAITTKVPKGQSLQTTVILLVDRQPGGEDSGATLTINSIDGEFATKPAKRKK